MIRKILKTFAKLNFGYTYYPVLHGPNTVSDVKPFVLMVKRRLRPISQQLFAKKEFITIAGLESYIKEEKRTNFLELIHSRKRLQNNLEIISEKVENKDEVDCKRTLKDRLLALESWIDIGFITAMVEGNVKIHYDMGELELGKLDQEYFKDPDLDYILQETELDKRKMARLEDEELHLIYSVIYSEKFHLGGKISQEISGYGGVAIPGPSSKLESKLKGYVNIGNSPPKIVSRNTRGPLYFKPIRVKYDKKRARLQLLKGKFAGNQVLYFKRPSLVFRELKLPAITLLFIYLSTYLFIVFLHG
ncbi:uncharacterized protein LOC113668047 isoform X2 [Pocillopora damicornis]|uniref:uncharacterized protein LOC113668047 isoform X2 n=1 Tax=Pocillopora damicornis TaxID=46731 RepID=UPI000F553BEB|nr:uncharacterized protein LOC113668047 isoform X2 [Pocillopora damicornis]